MNWLQLLNKISIVGILILTIKIIFFEKYFPQSINRMFLLILIALIIVFPITEIQKKKNIK